jgi:hypothetical protein
MKCVCLLYLLVCINCCSKPIVIETTFSFSPTTTLQRPAHLLPLILWNGKSQATGVSWVPPDGNGITIATEDTSVHSGKTVIVLLFAHPSAFFETGWQWSTWLNLKPVYLQSCYSLTIAIRITSTCLSDNLSLAFPCDHNITQRLSLKHYTPLVIYSGWNEVAIQLKKNYSSGIQFEPGKVIQTIF